MSAQVVPLDAEKEDEELLDLCKAWQLSAAAHIGMEPEKRSANCNRMEEIAGRLSAMTPTSFAGLRAILTVAATILSARAIDPDGYVGSGDAFGLVAAALRAAEFGGGKIGGAS